MSHFEEKSTLSIKAEDKSFRKTLETGFKVFFVVFFDKVFCCGCVKLEI